MSDKSDARRLLKALGIGVLITILAFVITVAVGSQRLAGVLLWQARMLCYRECPPDDICEGTPVDVMCGLMGLFFGVIIYTVASYLVLTFFSNRRAKRSHK